MAKPAVKQHPKPRRPGRRPDSVIDVRLTTPGGAKVVVASIDGNSETFADDLLYVFARNVRAAREENRKKLGSPSGVKKAR